MPALRDLSCAQARAVARARSMRACLEWSCAQSRVHGQPRTRTMAHRLQHVPRDHSRAAAPPHLWHASSARATGTMMEAAAGSSMGRMACGMRAHTGVMGERSQCSQ